MSDGRWPANVILSPGMAKVLDQQSGISKDGVAVKRNKSPDAFESNDVFGKRRQLPQEDQGYKGEGGASRFFLNAGYEPWELEWIYSVGLRPYESG